MTEQHEVEFGAYAGTNGIDFQTAYSPVKHFGVMADFSNYNDESQDTTRFIKHRMFEGAVGGYYPFDEQFVPELYAGYGQGVSENYNNYWSSLATLKEGKYRKLFVQPGFGITSDIIDAAIHTRFVFVNYYEVNSVAYDERHQTDSNYDTFVEPALTFRAGYKFIKFQMQVGVSFPVREVIYDYQPFMISFGMHLNISKKYFND